MPTLEAVESADVRQLLSWNRFLPGPRSDDEVTTLNRICERLAETRAADPAAYVAASKSLGW